MNISYFLTSGEVKCELLWKLSVKLILAHGKVV